MEFLPAIDFFHELVEFDEFAFFIPIGDCDFGDVSGFVGEFEHMGGDLWEVSWYVDIF